jgi:hypothetical protein
VDVRSGPKPTGRESFVPRSIRPRSRRPERARRGEPRCPMFRPISSTRASTNGRRSEGDRARIGITAFAQEQLGDVVFVSCPRSAPEWAP